MNNRSRIMQLGVFGFVLFVGLGMLLEGCGEKKPVPETKSQTHGESLTSQTVGSFQYPKGVSFPTQFTQGKVAIEVGNGRVIPFLTTTVNSLHEVIGQPNTSQLSFTADGKDIYLEEYLDSGLSVSYEKATGAISEILLTSAAYSVSGGGKVGDTWQMIESLYPGGYETENESKKYGGRKYLYLAPDTSDPTSAVGYKFYFKSDDTIGAIVVGYIGFVP